VQGTGRRWKRDVVSPVQPMVGLSLLQASQRPKAACQRKLGALGGRFIYAAASSTTHTVANRVPDQGRCKTTTPGQRQVWVCKTVGHDLQDLHGSSVRSASGPERPLRIRRWKCDVVAAVQQMVGLSLLCQAQRPGSQAQRELAALGWQPLHRPSSASPPSCQ